MTARAECGCGRVFEVPDALAGGITNCPGCGRATSVAGLRDPFWRVLQAAAALGVLAAAVLGGLAWGAPAGLLLGLGLAGLCWLLSRAL